MGPNPADPFGDPISLDTTSNRRAAGSLSPDGPPTLSDSIVSWTPTTANAGKDYVVIFGAGSLTLLSTLTMSGSFRLIVSSSELAMTVDMDVDLADLGSVNATGALLIDATGVAGALQIGIQAGTMKSGPGFSLSGTASLLVNTRSAAVPALSLPAGPYAQVGVAGTLAIGLETGTSFVMAGNFILTTSGTEVAVTASADPHGRDRRCHHLLHAVGWRADDHGERPCRAYTLGSGGSAGLSGNGFAFSGFFTLDVNTTGEEVAKINGRDVNLAAGPYVRVLVDGDPAVAGSKATSPSGRARGTASG